MDAHGTVARLGVLGGTFDPIHLGHLVAASEALHAFQLDRVLFVPAARPWQRSSVTDPEDRLTMTILATASHPRFAVSRMELDRRGPTYTVDTLTTLREVMGDAPAFFFILGSDALLNLGTWERVEELAGLAELIAVRRPGHEIHEDVGEPSWPLIHVIDIPQLAISAADVRARVREGRPIDYLVPGEVADFIRSKGLYMGTDGDAHAS